MSVLIADIGATNARFAMADGTTYHDAIVIPCAEHDSLEEASLAYLDRIGSRVPAAGALAVAGPVRGGTVKMTNHPWDITVEGMRAALGVSRLSIVNDFVAVALAAPLLRPEDWVQVGPGEAVPCGAMALIGPGTGLGMAGLVCFEGRWVPVPSEGGHMSAAAQTGEEAAVLDRIRARFGHASYERVVAGSQMASLHAAVGEVHGFSSPAGDGAAVGRLAEAGDPHAIKTLDYFLAFLGSAAGDLALAMRATGGVYVAGGIVPRYLDRLGSSPLRARFEAKGRMSDLLSAVPMRVVVHEMPAFLGLAGMARQWLQ